MFAQNISRRQAKRIKKFEYSLFCAYIELLACELTHKTRGIEWFKNRSICEVKCVESGI
jgi:hypothetical protein